jgi:hypothetical protein
LWQLRIFKKFVVNGYSQKVVTEKNHQQVVADENLQKKIVVNGYSQKICGG